MYLNVSKENVDLNKRFSLYCSIHFIAFSLVTQFGERLCNRKLGWEQGLLACTCIIQIFLLTGQHEWTEGTTAQLKAGEVSIKGVYGSNTTYTIM